MLPFALCWADILFIYFHKTSSISTGTNGLKKKKKHYQTQTFDIFMKLNLSTTHTGCLYIYFMLPAIIFVSFDSLQLLSPGQVFQ